MVKLKKVPKQDLYQDKPSLISKNWFAENVLK